jgi:hypothetical protein
MGDGKKKDKRKPPAPVILSWDATRHGESELAAKVWNTLDDPSKKLLQSLLRCRPVQEPGEPRAEARAELGQLAVMAGATHGEIEIVQRISAIETACTAVGRKPCVTVVSTGLGPVARFERAACMAFLRNPN